MHEPKPNRACGLFGPWIDHLHVSGRFMRAGACVNSYCSGTSLYSPGCLCGSCIYLFICMFWFCGLLWVVRKTKQNNKTSAVFLGAPRKVWVTRGVYLGLTFLALSSSIFVRFPKLIMVMTIEHSVTKSDVRDRKTFQPVLPSQGCVILFWVQTR